jgi:TonB family protein
MPLTRWSGTALVALLAVLQFPAAADAQVWGEILVGPRPGPLTGPLAAVAPAPGDPGSEASGGAGSPQGEDLQEPRLVLLAQTTYPRAARAARQEGSVMVCFTVDERGRVHMPAVRASSDPVFNPPVLEAISASRFSPALLGKTPVRSTACRTFRFELR